MTDYQEAVQNPGFCFTDAELQSGLPVTGLWNMPEAMSGNFAVVFQIRSSGHTYAVKCFTTYHPDQEQRYAIIAEYLQQARLPYMVGFVFLRQGIKIRGQWYPILKMEWVHGESLDSYIVRNLKDSEAIQNLANRFVDLTSALEHYKIAHGDLQHGNILVVNGDIRLRANIKSCGN